MNWKMSVVTVALLTAGCARNTIANTFPVVEGAKLIGGDCIGAANLPKGWKIYAQKLDIDDELVSPAEVLLRAPEPEYKGFFSKYVTHKGLIEAQVRDMSNVPDFAGRSNYEDRIRQGLPGGGGVRSTLRNGTLTLEGYAGGATQYFLANDAKQTLLTCTPPGHDEEPWCKVTTEFKDGKYRITTGFTYDQVLNFKDMVAQATAAVPKVFVPCGR